MVKKKKRKVIIITLSIIIILAIIATFVLLYLFTDMFKSNQVLFAKYLSQNLNNLQNVQKNFQNSEYDNLLNQNKYTSTTDIKMNYINGLGTTLENTNNAINNLQINIDGQTDIAQGYNYQNIKLMNNNENVANIEYIQENNKYGIRFSDLFQQFTTVENANLNELISKIGQEDNMQNFPNQLDFNTDIMQTVNFSEQETNNLTEKYLNLLNESTTNQNFSKRSNTSIKINNQDIRANAYILTLTKEQLNNLYVKILEQSKQEEIILNKLDNIQSQLEKYAIKLDKNLRDYFVDELDTKIQEINATNIGSENTSIIVYESDSNTIKTTIETPDYVIDLNCINNQYLEFNNQNSEKSVNLRLEKDSNNIEIQLTTNADEITKTYTISDEKLINGNNATRNILFRYEDVSNRLEANLAQNIEFTNQFDNQVILDEQNNITFNDLEAEEIQNLYNAISNGVNRKIEELSGKIDFNQLRQIFLNIGWISERQEIPSDGLSQTEINRFNVQFEFIKGNEIASGEVAKIIESIRNNIIAVETASETEFRLKIDMNESNQDEVNAIVGYFNNEQNRSKTYNISLEYNEENGLISYVVIKEVEKQQ